MQESIAANLLFMPETEQLRFLPEGPTALAQGVFSWVAIQHGADSSIGSLNIYDVEAGSNKSFELPGRPGFAKPTTQEGVFVVGCERALGLFDIRDQSWKVLVDNIDDDVEGTIINDGTLYGDNVVFGTKDLEFKTAKAGLYLYRLSDNQLIRMRNDQVCSNGKDVVDAGDGGLHLIDIDSPKKKVVRYKLNIEKGELTDCETVVDLSDLPAVPDGMVLTPDEQSMIISFYNPNEAPHGETRQYSLFNGELERTWITLGSPQATCPLLMEMVDGTVKLVITTAIEHMPNERRENAPNAGGLFVGETRFRTAPATPRLPIS